jgi:hypothetical protein
MFMYPHSLEPEPGVMKSTPCRNISPLKEPLLSSHIGIARSWVVHSLLPTLYTLSTTEYVVWGGPQRQNPCRLASLLSPAVPVEDHISA